MPCKTPAATVNQVTIDIPPDAFAFLEYTANVNGFTIDHWCSLLIMRTVVEDREQSPTYDDRGQNNFNSKLTEAQALEVIAQRGKELGPHLAARLGLSLSAVHSIWGGKSWKHLPRN
jgi:hypothetical protein